jgi:glutamate formiminotransferase/formiminotetrahydrofolate cyclodeaminase
MKPVLECVPNFSEGRDASTIKRLVNGIEKVPNVKVLHVDMGYDANRTVVTFAGEPDAVIAGAFIAIKLASELIDMRKQKGEHPRIGSTDVCPLIPVRGITMQETIALSNKLGKKIGDELNIPVILYEKSASKPLRRNLAAIRKGEYEEHQSKLLKPEWRPDYGPLFNEKTGVTVIGARDFLIAYNINIESTSVKLAQKIAGELRESGYWKTIENKKQHYAGALKYVKAIGWWMESYGCVQVSTNLVRYQSTGLHDVYETTKNIAENYEVRVTGSELIGLVPRQAIINAGKFYAPDIQDEDELIEIAAEKMKINAHENFRINDRILENHL